MMDCFLWITLGCLGSTLDSCACFKVSIYFRKSDIFGGAILSWTNAVGDANFTDQNTHNRTYFVRDFSLVLLPTWNTNNNRTVINNETFCINKNFLSYFWDQNVKIKCHKIMWAYYLNLTATFHCFLVNN